MENKNYIWGGPLQANTWSYNSYKQGYNPSSVYRVYSLVGAHLVGGVWANRLKHRPIQDENQNIFKMQRKQHEDNFY